MFARSSSKARLSKLEARGQSGAGLTQQRGSGVYNLPDQRMPLGENGCLISGLGFVQFTFHLESETWHDRVLHAHRRIAEILLTLAWKGMAAQASNFGNCMCCQSPSGLVALRSDRAVAARLD